MSQNTTIGAVIRRVSADLAQAGIADPLREARLIATSVLDIPMARLTLSLDEVLKPGEIWALHETARGRMARRPLSHVIGKRAFFKHEFRVGPEVLDPRPETEALVRVALTVPCQRVLDLGIGSGAILLSVLAERPAARGVGTDISVAAVEMARVNVERLGMAERCELLQSDWFDQVAGQFDLILSNPPYIARAEMEGLAPELAFEPRIALTDEGDGLGAYRILTAQSGAHLRPGGYLMVEIGWQQAAVVSEMFRFQGFADVAVLPDLDGRARVVTGQWPG